jgi:hypothetical protein
VFVFIADLALSFAFKVSAWCLGKTYDGIAYLVSRRNKTNDDDGGDEFVVISLEDYRALRRTRVRAPVNHAPVNHAPVPESSVPSDSASFKQSIAARMTRSCGLSR